MIRQMTFALMGLSALTIAATRVEAQNRQCGPHQAVVAHLAQGYDEVRHMIGLAANGMVLELYAAAETGTWTIIVTQPGGQTCLLASGSDADLTLVDMDGTDPDA